MTRRNECAVRDCTRERATDAQVCSTDLAELYFGRLDRNADGTYSRQVVRMPEWRRRALAGQGVAKDMTGRIAA